MNCESDVLFEDPCNIDISADIIYKEYSLWLQQGTAQSSGLQEKCVSFYDESETRRQAASRPISFNSKAPLLV